LRLCSIDFSQGDFNQKGGQNNQQGQQRGQQNNQQSSGRQVQRHQGVDFRTLVATVNNPNISAKLRKQAQKALGSYLDSTSSSLDLNTERNKNEAAPYKRSEKFREDVGKVATKIGDTAKAFVNDPGKSIDTAKGKLGEFLAGKPKTLEKDVKVKNKTTGKFDTIAKKGSVVRDKDGKAVMEKEGLIPTLDKAKKQVDDIVTIKAKGKESKDLTKKEVKGAYKQVGKEISSNISNARDIGVGIKDAINPNAKFKRIAKYGKGGEVSRLGRAVSRGDTRLGETKLSKAIGWTLQKGGSSAMQKKATKDYERKQTLRSMRGFSEEEMRVYDEIFKALIEEDFTTVKPGDQSEKPISEEVLKELIDTNFYEANDSEEKKYHESVVKGYSFNESTGRYESLSREIFGEA